MLYIVGNPWYSVNILDTDDMVIESVSRKELNTILRNGIKIANIDRKVALKHPRSEIMTSRYATETKFINESYSGIEAHIKIPHAFSMIKGLMVHNEKYNFYIKYESNPVSKFVLWINCFYYELHVIVNKELKYELWVNNKLYVNFGSEEIGGHELEYLGFCLEDCTFKIYFHHKALSFDDDVMSYWKSFNRETSERIGIPMSEAEFKRNIVFA